MTTSPAPAELVFIPWKSRIREARELTLVPPDEPVGEVTMAAELSPGRFLLGYSSVMFSSWPLWLGEVVHADPDENGRYWVTRVETPLKMRHYESGWTEPEGPVAELVHGLGGEWESLGAVLLNWLHVPVEAAARFKAGMKSLGKWPLRDAQTEREAD